MELSPITGVSAAATLESLAVPQKFKNRPGMEAHTYNPSYSGSRNQEIMAQGQSGKN
jgi:hypothetical protein